MQTDRDRVREKYVIIEKEKMIEADSELQEWSGRKNGEKEIAIRKVKSAHSLVQ